MSGWQEHFLDKYFAYRERYVAAIVAQAPGRKSWAVAAEVARLSFVLFGCSICAAILWVPTLQQAGQGRFGLGVILTGLCAGAATLLGIRTLGGWWRAVNALRGTRLLK